MDHKEQLELFEDLLDAASLHLVQHDQENKLQYYDPVNNPQHYTAGNIECIDALKAALTQEELEGFLKGNILKYLWRAKRKGKEQEDIQKAKWYLDLLAKQ